MLKPVADDGNCDVGPRKGCDWPGEFVLVGGEFIAE